MQKCRICVVVYCIFVSFEKTLNTFFDAFDVNGLLLLLSKLCVTHIVVVTIKSLRKLHTVNQFHSIIINTVGYQFRFTVCLYDMALLSSIKICNCLD